MNSSKLENDILTSKLDAMLGDLKDNERIMLLRKRLNINQFEICSGTGILPQMLSAYELGRKELPIEKVAEIVKLLEQWSERT